MVRVLEIPLLLWHVLLQLTLPLLATCAAWPATLGDRSSTGTTHGVVIEPEYPVKMEVDSSSGGTQLKPPIDEDAALQMGLDASNMEELT